MFQHILIATDGSLLSESVVDKAMDLAREAGARVTVITAIEPSHSRAEAARYLAEAERKAKASGVQCNVTQVEDAHPYKAIIDTAKKFGCDLIAMASHGRRGTSALLIGSETTKVLTHSSIPVLVYR